MSYSVVTPSIKKKFCKHRFERKWKQGTSICELVCSKCRTTNPLKSKNEKLTKYFSPAFKRTISILATVANFVDDFKFLTNWQTAEYQEWHLPATAEPHYWCGLWKTEGCLQTELHKKLGKGKMIYLKQFQRSCYRAKCKACYLKWIARQANSATRRIEQYSKDTGKKPIHLILCVPPSQYETPVKVLRQRMSRIQKIAKIEGTVVIFHPFRFSHKQRNWYPAPHFHLVGFASERNIKNAFGSYGWFVKNMGQRESTFQTLCYLLSHCGINKDYKTVTWYGSLSYSNLHVEKEPKITKCPVCGGDFVEIYYHNEYGEFNPVVPPDKPYEGLVDAEGWYRVGTEPTPQISEYRFDYAPTRDLNETLKGLAMAN